MLLFFLFFLGKSSEVWTLNVSDLEPLPSSIVAPMVDKKEQIFFLDPKEGAVYHLDSQGRLIKVFGSLGQGPGEFTYPNKIGVSAKSGRIYIADPGKRKLWVFDAGSQEVVLSIPLGLDAPYVIGDRGVLIRDTESTIGQANQGCKVVVKFNDRSEEKLLTSYDAADHPDPLSIYNGPAKAFIRPDWMIQVLVAVSPDQKYIVSGSSRNLTLNLFETEFFSNVGRIQDETLPLLPLAQEDIEADPTKVTLNGKTYTLKDFDLPETKALIGHLLMDTENRIWVGLMPSLGQTTFEYRVYGLDGKHLGTIKIATGEIFHATAKNFWHSYMDDQGENYLAKKRYTLEP